MVCMSFEAWASVYCICHGGAGYRYSNHTDLSVFYTEIYLNLIQNTDNFFVQNINCIKLLKNTEIKILIMVVIDTETKMIRLTRHIAT